MSSIELALRLVPLIMHGLSFGLLWRALALIEGFRVDVCVCDIDGDVDGVYTFVGICDAFVASFLLIGEVLVLGKSAIRKASHCLLYLF